MFVMSCSNIIVVTEGVIWRSRSEKDPKSLAVSTEEMTLRYRFTIQNSPGKWHRGSGAVSCHLVAMLQTLFHVFPAKPSQSGILECNSISDIIESTALMETFADSNNIAIMLPDLIHAAGRGNPRYKE